MMGVIDSLESLQSEVRALHGRMLDADVATMLVDIVSRMILLYNA